MLSFIFTFKKCSQHFFYNTCFNSLSFFNAHTVAQEYLDRGLTVSVLCYGTTTKWKRVLFFSMTGTVCLLSQVEVRYMYVRKYACGLFTGC